MIRRLRRRAVFAGLEVCLVAARDIAWLIGRARAARKMPRP